MTTDHKDKQHYSMDIAEACEALDRLSRKLVLLGVPESIHVELSTIEGAMVRLTSYLLDKAMERA